MSSKFNIPIIGGDEELLQQLVADNAKLKKNRPRPNVPRNKDRRAATRYDLAIGVVCFPLMPSLEIDPSGRVDAIIVDLSENGVGLNVASQNVNPGETYVLAVESESIGWRFIDFRVLNVTPCGKSSTHVCAKFDSPLHKLFNDDLVVPTLNTQTYQYGFAFSDSVLTSLCAIGAAQRINMDSVMACPDCLAVPTVRRGCSICFSNETAKSKMIHHFACAHVDFVERFKQEDEIVCPKCLGQKMIIGADYEYLEGPIQCLECGHKDLEEILIGHCMHCACRFPFEKATSIDIVGYRVNRLDPLALLNTA